MTLVETATRYKSHCPKGQGALRRLAGSGSLEKRNEVIRTSLAVEKGVNPCRSVQIRAGF